MVVKANANIVIEKVRKDLDQACLINHNAVPNIPNTDKDQGCRFLHFSTGSVFDGISSLSYKESGEPYPR